jgi:tetratricopeptide (TPR) repeat protein
MSNAVVFAEEAYNVVAIFYDPVHPNVQAAAAILINCLKQNGDHVKAELFAEVNYSTLRDHKNGKDQEGDEMAEGSYNLADIIHKQKGDLVKAEKLARESLRIRVRLFHSEDFRIGDCSFLLARILQSRNNLGDETKDLFIRALAIFTRNEGPDGMNTAEGNIRVGEYYYQQFKIVESKEEYAMEAIKHLFLAKKYLEEGCRIESLLYGLNNPSTYEAVDLLAAVISNLT